ncbi:restriction endonuclease [Beijerinckia mobilis]|uniref:restriction endonuclease n=1 Tax=Beijerinckia mobilis TaxID=231434 RepID=UPI0005575591|nr:restriction endonuclease [Beijerinckia mobilis]
MAIPDYQSLMLPILRNATERDVSIPEIADRIADEFGLTQDEKDSLLPSGKQRILHNRMHWAKFYMSKAGLLDSPRRGRFIASADGRKVLARNPSRIDLETLLNYPLFREFYKGNDSASPSSLSLSEDLKSPSVSMVTPEEQIEAAYLDILSALQADLLVRIQQNSSNFFEELIISLLVAMGYGGSHRHAAQQLGRSGDGGVDGVINEDPLGLDRVYVQAKRYASANAVSRPDVQAFVGSLVGFGATKGVFVTTSYFSSQACEYVRHLSQRVILIDGQRLTDLMIEHNVGVRIDRAVEIKRIDEDFFLGED